MVLPLGMAAQVFSRLLRVGWLAHFTGEVTEFLTKWAVARLGYNRVPDSGEASQRGVLLSCAYCRFALPRPRLFAFRVLLWLE